MVLTGNSSGVTLRSMTRTRRWLALVAAAVTIASLLGVAAASAQAAGGHRPRPSAANPTVTGPVTGGKGAIVLPGTTTFSLSSVAYTQSEFFISGQASSYAPTAPLGSDGEWQVAPATTASYTTRIVVYRPADPARFNGTVVVEWLNVSAGVDAAAEWLYSHNEMIRDGFAYVGVSAQVFHRFRLWEMAGTSHADNYETNIGAADNGSAGEGLKELNSMLNPPAGAAGLICATPINTGQEHFVLDAAQFWLNRWVRTGDAPPRAPRLQVNTSTTPPSFVTDANGNVEGGIRTPAVDVPVATLSGLGQSGSSFCFLFGTTVPFSAAKLAALYPTHARFVKRWARDTIDNARDGFIRPDDADELIDAAAASNVGG
jgi:Alpha/beta hydrolase domain